MCPFLVVLVLEYRKLEEMEKRLNGESFREFYCQLKAGNLIFVTAFVLKMFRKKPKACLLM